MGALRALRADRDRRDALGEPRVHLLLDPGLLLQPRRGDVDPLLLVELGREPFQAVAPARARSVTAAPPPAAPPTTTRKNTVSSSQW